MCLACFCCHSLSKREYIRGDWSRESEVGLKGIQIWISKQSRLTSDSREKRRQKSCRKIAKKWPKKWPKIVFDRVAAAGRSAVNVCRNKKRCKQRLCGQKNLIKSFPDEKLDDFLGFCRGKTTLLYLDRQLPARRRPTVAGIHYVIITQPRTDVMIFKIFSPKIFSKKMAFLTQNKAKFWKKVDHNIGI
jgi:hypothetical protein